MSDYVRLAGDSTRAMALAEEAVHIAREADDRRLTAWCLTSLGATAHLAGDYERTEALYAEALALADESGDEFGAAHARHMLAYSRLNRGRIDEARQLWERSLEYYRTSDDESGLSLVLQNVAELEWKDGNLDRAWELTLEGLTLAERVRRAIIPAYILAAAGIAVDGGEPELGAVLLGAYDTSAAASGRGKNEDDLAEEQEIVERGIASLGAEVWNQARAEGRNLSVNGAVNLIREYAAPPELAPAQRQGRRRRGLRLVR
jgi:tetratricopeptide (TPR) repeat protein